MISKGKNSGFTLIELLVVIAIIGILLAIATFGMAGARADSRDAKRKADLETIRSGLELYKSDCNKYPDTADFPDAGEPLVGTDTTGACLTTNKYIEVTPGDPVPADNRIYYYNYDSVNRTYELCAALEGGGSGSCSGSCGTGISCNYRVRNP